MEKLRPDQIETLIDYLEDYVKELILSSHYGGEEIPSLVTARKFFKRYITELVGEEE